MQNINTTPQENFPQVMFETHVFQDRVIFSLPLLTTLDTLVPLALELLHMPGTCKLEVRLTVDDGQLVISFGKNL